MQFEQKKRYNWLLQGLILFSIGIHILIFLHVEGIYRTNALSYIELTLNEISRPSNRAIPSPPLRPKRIPKPSTENRKVYKEHRPVSDFRPMKIDNNNEHFSKSIVESINIARDPRMENPAEISKWAPPAHSGTAYGDYTSSMSYFDMVRFKIETKKRYPEDARREGIEGRVVISFVIISDGTVKNERVIKGSYYPVLNDAAIQAVRAASPFPAPPKRLFGDQVPVNITMIFELT